MYYWKKEREEAEADGMQLNLVNTGSLKAWDG